MNVEGQHCYITFEQCCDKIGSRHNRITTLNQCCSYVVCLLVDYKNVNSCIYHWATDSIMFSAPTMPYILVAYPFGDRLYD